MTILCHVADGIGYMHSKRICHGDLNPSNVLLKVCCLCLTVLLLSLIHI